MPRVECGPKEKWVAQPWLMAESGSVATCKGTPIPMLELTRVLVILEQGTYLEWMRPPPYIGVEGGGDHHRMWFERSLSGRSQARIQIRIPSYLTAGAESIPFDLVWFVSRREAGDRISPY